MLRLASNDGVTTGTGGAPRRPFARLGAAALLLGGLAACSAAPDWARPSAIYGGEKPAAAPADGAAFPDLADVPDQKPQTTSPERQKEIASGLAADREQARHTDQVLRGGTEPPAPPPQVSAPSPVPALKDVPPEAPKDKSSALEPARVLPMPARGGHASLEAVRGIKTAAADISRSKPEETPAADESEPGAIAAPTTPVEVQQTGTIARP